MKISQISKGFKIISNDIKNLMIRETDCVLIKPRVATLFLTYRCNSRCKTCSMWKRDQAEAKKSEIHFKEWKIIIDALHEQRIREAEIFGGNVLLRKDLLIPLLEYMTSKNIEIHMPTNQIGMDHEISSAIFKYVSAVYISTDGIGEVQDTVRGQQGSFERVNTTVSTLLQLRRECGVKGPRIICNTTVSRYNINDVQPIIEYAINTGFDEIHLEPAGEMTHQDAENSMINGLKPSIYYIRTEESILPSLTDVNHLLNSLRGLKQKYSSFPIQIHTLNLEMMGAERIATGEFPNRRCCVERLEATVDPSGNLIACPFYNNFIFGNLLEEPFEKIWNNQKHRLFRSFQNRNKIAICRHCILGPQRNPTFVGLAKRIYHNRVDDFLQTSNT